MTVRSSPADAAGRVHGVAARGTIKKSNDKKKVQEVDVELLKDETHRGVEVFGQYGFKSVPVAKEGKNAAEVIVIFPGGNRAHGVVIAVDDRRYRPKDWKAGEVGMYDDQDQVFRISRDGIVVDGGKNKKPLTFQSGSSKVTIADGEITIEAENIYLIGNVAAGVDSKETPTKVLTESGPAKKLWSKV